MRRCSILMFLVLAISVAGCRNVRTENIDSELIVYGRPGCHFCEAFREHLEDDEIPYTFRDIDELEYKALMWQEIDAHKPGYNDITLPVVLYKDQLLICPSYEDFLKLYSENNSSKQEEVSI